MKLNFLPYLQLADNTVLNSGTGGDSIHTDDTTLLNTTVVSGFKTQVVKLSYGADGVVQYVATATPLPVTTNVKPTYRAATAAPFAAAVTVNQVFFVISGSATKTIRVQSIIVSGISLTAVAYLAMGVGKYSTAPTGGTATALTKVPLDSTFASSTVSLCSVYTAVPTTGTKVGDISNRRHLGQATTAAAAGIPEEIKFDFSDNKEGGTVALIGTAQCVGLYWQVAPATAPTMSLRVEYCED